MEQDKLSRQNVKSMPFFLILSQYITTDKQDLQVLQKRIVLMVYIIIEI